jgi:uncharacterized protein (TIGR03032 family)
VFIVTAPGSGASALLRSLARGPGVWTLGPDARTVFDGLAAARRDEAGAVSDRLLAEDADPSAVQALEGVLLAQARAQGVPQAGPAGTRRLVDATAVHALRVPFLARAFPDASFVYLFRDPRAAIGAAVAEWRSGRSVTHPDLAEWSGPPWSLPLVPGWRSLRGLSLPEIAARQWQVVTRCLLDDLEALPPERWCVAGYDALHERPREEVQRLGGFLGLDLADVRGGAAAAGAPADVDERPGEGADVEKVLPELAAETERARELFARPPRVSAPAAVSPGAELRSVHTTSFPRLLAQLGASVLVSTYQSGRVVVLRAAGQTLNTHFRSFRSPMGLALGPRSLAIGTDRQIWLYRNVPALTPKLPPPGPHDACFLPQQAHVTGDIRVHEMAYAGEELWFVNTRFSCLCTLDPQHSFVPRWRPPFVSALAPEDRCHLNGLAIVDGRPRYVTAHGRSDRAAGWRQGKANGGVLVDVPSGEIVAAELCMPHSPRWHQGRLWVLESGAGTLARVDLERGRLETVTRLPGFTRGLAFAGSLAFVGLSQVRESVFGGIPLTESREPRFCGVWAVELQSGNVVGFVRFEDAVQEIFDVQLLPGLRFPELAEPESDLVADAFVLPDAALAQLAPPRTG